MNYEQLEAIRKRAEETSFDKAYVKGDPWKGYEIRNEGNGMVIAEVSCGTDAELFASSRQDIPMLLAEVERLREGLSEIAEIVSDFYTEQNGIRLPKNLSPIAGELRVIHTISLNVR